MKAIEAGPYLPPTSPEIAEILSTARSYLEKLGKPQTIVPALGLFCLGSELLDRQDPFAIPILTLSPILSHIGIAHQIASFNSEVWTNLYETGLRIQAEGGKVVFPGLREGQTPIEAIFENGQPLLIAYPPQKHQLTFVTSRLEAAAHMLRPGRIY